MGKETDIEMGTANGLKTDVKRYKLEWRELTVTKKIQEGTLFKPQTHTKDILSQVSGEASPGELLAIMGPSGGGKTSLLNTLSRRVKYTSGSVTLNGSKIPSNFNKISAYVMQDDRLFETLTPRELFQFSARLRLPKGTTEEEIQKAVERTIRKLGLEACSDTRVGGALARGLSGGERKRTSIGYELVTNPSLLFLDEPTSGLDSYNSLILINSLKQLAQEGQTVICTIHQPSTEIFSLFDKLLLLAKGKVVYFGEANKSIDYFSSKGFPCPNYTNPTDFFMKILQTYTEEDKERVSKLIEEGKQSQDLILSQLKSKSHIEDENHHHHEDEFEMTSTAPFYKQFIWLTQRSWVTQIRNPLAVQARAGQNIVIALLVGVIYLKLENYQVNIQDRVGALFFAGLAQAMTSINGVLLTFPLERALLVREYSNGMYSVSAYYLGKMAGTFIFDLFFPFLFSCICYWMVGFNPTAESFFCFILSVVVTSLSAGSMGLTLGSVFPNAEVAASSAPIMIIPFMLFAGFYVDLNTVPAWLSWIQYISIFKWSLQSLIINEFYDGTFECTPEEFVIAQGPDGPIQVCPVTSGKQVIKANGFDNTDFHQYWDAIAVLAGLFVFFRLLAWISLQLQTRRAVSKNQ